MQTGGRKWSFNHKLMGNGRQNHKFGRLKQYTFVVLMEIHAGENQGGDEKQLIDLEWPYSDTVFYEVYDCARVALVYKIYLG